MTFFDFWILYCFTFVDRLVARQNTSLSTTCEAMYASNHSHSINYVDRIIMIFLNCIGRKCTHIYIVVLASGSARGLKLA